MAEQFLAWAGPIGFFLTIGFLLDRVVEPRRKSIRDMLIFEDHSAISAFSDIRDAIENVFGSKLNSFKFVLRVGTLSISIFTIVFLLQDPGRVGDLWNGNGFGVAALVFCMAVNVILDCFSFRVTQLMIGLFSELKTLFSFLVAVGADFLISINLVIYISTLALAAYVSIFAFYFGNHTYQTPATSKYTITKTTLGPFDRYDVAVSNPIGKGYENTSNVSSQLSFLADQNSEFDLSAIGELRNAYFIKDGNVIDLATGNEVPVKTKREDETESSSDQDPLSPANRSLRSAPTGVYSMIVVGERKKITPRPPSTAIESAFTALSGLEANLGSILKGRVIDYNAVQIYLGRNPGFNPIFSENVCLDRKIYQERTTQNFEQCSGQVRAIGGTTSSYFLDHFGEFDEWFSRSFPVSTMMLTSIWFTALIYLSFFGILVWRRVLRFSRKRTNSLAHYFSKAPFSITSLGVGVVTTILLNTYG